MRTVKKVAIFIVALMLLITACTPSAETPTSGSASPTAGVEQTAESPTLEKATSTAEPSAVPTETRTEIPATATATPTPALPSGTLTLAGEYGYGTGWRFSPHGLQLSADEKNLIVTTTAGIFIFSADDLSPKLAIHEPFGNFHYYQNIRVSRDGTKAVATSMSSMGELALRLWDIASGSLLGEHTIAQDEASGFGPVMEVSVSPDNKVAVLVDQKGIILVVNLVDGTVIKKIEDYVNNTSVPLWMEFDSTGKRAYYIFQDVSLQGVQSVKLNTASWEESSIHTAKISPYFPWKFGVFSPKPSGSGFEFGYFTVFRGDTVAAMDYTTLAQRFKIPRGNRISAFAFSPDGSKVAMAGTKPTDLEIWMVDSIKEPEQTFRTSSNLWSVAVASDGETSFGVDENGILYKWQSGQSEPVTSREGFWPIGTGIEFTEEDQTLRLFTDNTYTVNNNVFELDSNNGALKSIIPNPYVLKDMKDEYPQSIALSPDKSLMAVVYGPYGDKAIRLFDYVTGKFVKKIPSKIGFDTIDFTPDGKSLIGYGLPDNPVQLIDLKTGKVIQKYPVAGEFPDGVAEMRLSGDKSTMVLLGWGGNLKVYDTSSFELTQSLDTSVLAYSFAISDDGKRVAILTEDGKLILWDVPSNSLLPEYNLEIKDGLYYILSQQFLDFSSDGQKLALSTWDGVIRVFDIAP